MELVFPLYDVVHYGSYHAVPGCRNAVTVRILEENPKRTVVITRQKKSTIPFSSHLLLLIRGRLPVAQPLHPHLDFARPGQARGGTGVQGLRRARHSRIQELHGGEGVLWIFSGEGADRANLIGGFCNIKREGIVHSAVNVMTLVFETRWRKVDNGRGFNAIYRGVHRAPAKPLEVLQNVALGKPTKQSSTMEGRYACLGVDNNNTNSATGSATCPATEFERDPWWQVNLQKRYRIYGFQLYSTNKMKAQTVGWPDGQYGLPMPVSGCPIGKGFSWKTGFRYHDMPYDIVQDNKVLHWSPGMLLKG
ncbi:contactin-associated protein like 5-3 [Caerostris extrusa]|uniref:Contactin-associated protein like 5-3 n=1 Tax=Caerostris extrusa TaxID=172846 RepID=A0AAV4Q229_CAEEX|nr:contactin-associated protein like 5-3 [Caerostris extrusa]